MMVNVSLVNLIFCACLFSLSMFCLAPVNLQFAGKESDGDFVCRVSSFIMFMKCIFLAEGILLLRYNSRYQCLEEMVGPCILT